MFKTYQHRMGQANYLAFLLLLFLMPYNASLVMWGAVLWIVTWALDFRLFTKPTLARENWKEMLIYAGLALWIIWEIVSLVWTSTPRTGWAFISRHAFILLAGFPALWGLSDSYKNKRQIFNAIIVSASLSIVAYLMTYFWMHDVPAYVDKHVPVTFQLDWIHFNELIGDGAKHRFYYSAFLATAMLAACYAYPLWKKTYGAVISSLLLVVALLWLGLGIYWSGSRTMPLVMAAIVCAAVLVSFKGKQRLIASGVTACVAMAFLFALFSFHPRYATLDSAFTAIPDSTYDDKSEPRFAEWAAVLESPADYSAYGVGVGAADDYLLQKYEKHQWGYLIAMKYNSHNQFFNEWIELGILAPVFLFLTLLAYPWTQRKQRRHPALYLMVGLILSLCTENIFTRLEGCIMLCILLVLTQIVALPNEE